MGHPGIATAATVCAVDTLSWAGIRRGLKSMFGATPAVFGFGVGFGAAASAVGMSSVAAISMSALVFAGASQYAALDLWQTPVPLVSLMVMTLAVNARHVVLGATIQVWIAPLPGHRRYSAIFLLSDANWAATHTAAAEGERDAGYLIGGGLALWLTWVAGTCVGALAGSKIGNLDRFGIDVLMPAFFACTLIAMAKSRRDLPPWGIAGTVAMASSAMLPSHWAILIGALSGGLFGAAIDDRD